MDWILILVVVALLVGLVALAGVHNLGGLSALEKSVKAHEIGVVRDQLSAGLSAELAALRQQFSKLPAQVVSALPPPAMPPPTVAPTPAAPTPATNTALLDRYIDRDDLMKSIGATNCPQMVTIDAAVVHNGFGPPLAYVKQPDGSMARG